MKKEIYVDLQNAEKLTAKTALYDYRGVGMTMVEYRKHLKKLDLEIQKKRYNRKKSTKTEYTLQEKLRLKKGKILAGIFYSQENYNGGVDIHDAESFSFLKDYDYDYNYYAKSYGHPKRFTKALYNINFSKLPLQYRKYWVIDGLVNSAINNIEERDGVVYVDADTIYRKKGDKREVVRTYIVIQNNIAYHSTESFEKAFKGINRKTTVAKKENKYFEITPDSVIDAKMYHKITGACWSGMRSFLESINKDINSKFKVKDILPILKDHNAYGWKKLENILL